MYLFQFLKRTLKLKNKRVQMCNEVLLTGRKPKLFGLTTIAFCYLSTLKEEKKRRGGKVGFQVGFRGKTKKPKV